MKNNPNLPFVERGTGTPVVFVHGAISDHRAWSRQIPDLARGYRCIVPDQRYFGAAPWPDDGRNYSVATHAADLIEFIERVSTEPVHVVAWSYGGGVALAAAVQDTTRIRSLFLNEPSLASAVSDSAGRTTIVEELKGLGPAAKAAAANDLARSTKLFCDWTAGLAERFSLLPEDFQEMFLFNARTIPPLLAAPPPTITAAQLGTIQVPVTLSMGALTRPFFAVQVRAFAKAIGRSQVVVFPETRHAAPLENPAAFNAAVQAHLRRVETQV
jgi:pimeloyl-ACP methyl ester carboxylesterase